MSKSQHFLMGGKVPQISKHPLLPFAVELLFQLTYLNRVPQTLSQSFLQWQKNVNIIPRGIRRKSPSLSPSVLSSSSSARVPVDYIFKSATIFGKAVAPRLRLLFIGQPRLKKENLRPIYFFSLHFSFSNPFLFPSYSRFLSINNGY